MIIWAWLLRKSGRHRPTDPHDVGSGVGEPSLQTNWLG